MEIAIITVMVVCSFVIGRLTATPQNKKMKKLESELASMTKSRDRWREKYLVFVMRAKLKELHEKNDGISGA
jgi:hypothetical protein